MSVYWLLIDIFTLNEELHFEFQFGLLKFYKEHDKAMEIIRERRRICLEELQLIEKS